MGGSIASRFDHIAIERSVLRAVIINDDALTLEMDFFLLPEHPDYETPAEGEGCFHPGLIKFAQIGKLAIDRAEPSDAARSRRFAIQSFAIDGTRFDMQCDWGTIHLQARSIRVLTE